MPKWPLDRHAELESFWRAHHEGWRQSTLNQREYCELHGLPLKRFGNWRAKFKHEDQAPPRKLLYRRGQGLSQELSQLINQVTNAGPTPAPRPFIPPTREGRRRSFSEAKKRQIVEETLRPGASIAKVANRYDIAERVLYRWKQELDPPADAPIFAAVQVTDAPEPPREGGASADTGPTPPAIIVERSPPGIEIELVGGRRVRFEQDVDPEMIKRMVHLLEEGTS